MTKDTDDAATSNLETLGILACGIAHDFNNVLMGITGLLALLEMDAESPVLVRSHVSEIRQATSRAADLTRQVLTFGRCSAANRTVTRLHQVAQEAVGLLRSTLPKSIRIDAILDPDAPFVLADCSQVHRIVVNLGANAAHAMRGMQGSLEVRLATLLVDEAGPAPRPEVAPGRYAHLLMCDNGAGMDTETQQRIFDCFFTTKESAEGSGLGLAVVHGIVAEHAGYVFVDSAPGKGACFHVLFPEHVVETSRIPHAGHTTDV